MSVVCPKCKTKMTEYYCYKCRCTELQKQNNILAEALGLECSCAEYQNRENERLVMHKCDPCKALERCDKL